jgi:hypothetical protein
MPELRGSTRRIAKATYAPILPEPADLRRITTLPRVWEKLSFIRSLRIRQSELSALERRIKIEPILTSLAPALRTLKDFSATTQPGRAIRTASQLATVAAKELASLGRLLAEERRGAKATVERQFEKIHEAYQREIARLRSSGEIAAGEMAENTDISTRPGGDLFLSTGRPGSASIGTSVDITQIAEDSDEDGLGDLETVYAWAKRNMPELVRPITLIADELWPAAAYSPSTDEYKFRDLLIWLDLFPVLTDSSVDAFQERMTIEPLGRLHLERLEMTPAGIEKGELVYTLPLAPKETVNISHKEWATTTEEFEQIVQDSFEDYSEEGVSEKSDLSQSTESETSHATAFSLSANYSHFGVSGSIGYNSTSGDTKGQQDSRQQSIEITRKASSRSRKDHKVSFKVTSVAGTENQEVRVITNPTTDAMRIDYFQLMRRWRVDLYRYGLRMTYDLAIPNPGADLIQNLGEIRALDALIERPFHFNLPLSQVRRTNWAKYAARFGAIVSVPPDEIVWVGAHREYGFVSEDEADHGFADALELEVDSDYEIATGRVDATFAHWSGHTDAAFEVMLDEEPISFTTGRVSYRSRLQHLNGRSGKVSVVYRGRWLTVGLVIVQLKTRLKSTAFDRWRIASWNAMREAAEQSYQESRRSLIDRREKLAAELAQFDALTLRKMEREEVMKTVLRWLFGPDFDLIPTEIAAHYTTLAGTDVVALDPALLSAASWQAVLEYGEFIKFIHQAIEWENVLFFVYPYFWDSPANAGLKRFLHHPDFRHREFLRGGSARVVLTVRPGFEESFTRLVETGSFSALSADHPYITVAQEIRNFAQTNYPGIPPANPNGAIDEDEINGAEKGIRIGSWYEYTPTSGLDISINTPQADLA